MGCSSNAAAPGGGGGNNTGANANARLYGKYRGVVVDNEDLMELGRIMVEVAALPGMVASWAMPSVPYAGPEVGWVFMPPIGANVWIEFEMGNPSLPIWSGCFWGEGEKPVEALTAEQKVLQTTSVTMLIDDIEGAGVLMVTLREPGVVIPVTVTFDEAGLQAETAEAIISMAPEEISLTLPPTDMTMTNEGLVLETPGTVEVEAADVEVTAIVEIIGDTSITGAVEIEGNTEIVGAVEIEGNVEIAGAVEIEGNVEILGAVEIEGDMALLGAFEVVGDIALAGALEAIDIAAAAMEGTGEGVFTIGIPPV